jgi:CRP-like cAMP-binding protein
MEKVSANSLNCLTCPARGDGLCTELASADLVTMRRFKSGDRKVRAGKDIFSPGEPCNAIYNLVEGWAFRYNLLEDGRRQILDFVLPGAVLGFHPAKGATATFGAQALTDVVLCLIPQENLASLSRAIPETGMRLARLISRDLSLAYDRLTSVGRQSARERVAHLILELFIRYRAQWPGHRPDEMHLPLTQEHVGDATGLTSVHVNRVLHDLREEGILEFHYRRLRVLNPDRLVEIAEVDPNLAMHWTRKLARPDDFLPPAKRAAAERNSEKFSSLRIGCAAHDRPARTTAANQFSARPRTAIAVLD